MCYTVTVFCKNIVSGNFRLFILFIFPVSFIFCIVMIYYCRAVIMKLSHTNFLIFTSSIEVETFYVVDRGRDGVYTREFIPARPL